MQGLAKFLEEGGTLMYINLVVSIITLAIIIDRAIFFLGKGSVNAKAFLEQIRKLVLANNIDRAVKLCSATEAPISHHWLDSTHITYGVVTLGYVLGNVKLEGSAFRGREPDQNRYDIETGKLDSASMRLSYNPTRNWAFQVSRGHIVSPEQLHPDDDVDRTTASAIFQHDFGGARWQTTAAWGRNKPSHGDATDAWLLESSISLSKTHTFFARAERADKNELFLPADPRDHETFTVGKLTGGYIYDFPTDGHFKVGVGGLASKYSLPSELDPVYGSNPTSFMLFARIKIQ